MHSSFEPYYAVIFTSKKSLNDEGYAVMAQEMETLAQQQQGFIGMDSARNEIGITVSYWKTHESIIAWKQHVDHVIAQKMGNEKWYDFYNVKVCKVEREYSFERK